MKLTVQSTVQAPIALVWQAYTSPDAICQWNAASPDWHTPRAEVDLRVGGRFVSRMEAKDGSMGFDFEGTYTEVQPPHRLAYTMGDREALVVFTELPSGGVHVQVTFDAEPTHSIEQQQQGWQAILDNFVRYIQAR